ncbi:MAG: hypothetical protein ACP5HU_08720 [Phycisphaerae bacterium]
MDEKTIQRIQHYLELFEHIKSKGIGDDAVAVAIIQEVAKDRRMEYVRNDRQSAANGNGSEPATEKQREYLSDLGVKVKPGLTKQEASAMLDKLLAKQGQ